MTYTNQQGQAMLAMLAFTLVLAMVLVYVFNSSQVLAERAQAKVLADHAAFSTATKQAQLLNANAYMNKAIIVNQLATAQAVSVGSWLEYFENTKKTLDRSTNNIPVIGPFMRGAMTFQDGLLMQAKITTPVFIETNATATRVILAQQDTINEFYSPLLEQEPNVVIKNSSIGTGFEANLNQAQLWSNKSFITKYSGNNKTDPYDGRLRMKEVLLNARDNFTARRREKNERSLTPFFRLKMRGGTEISDDMNSWQAVDTLSVHSRRLTWRGWRPWRETVPIGYGSAASVGDRIENLGYQNAAGVNPRAYRLAKQSQFKSSIQLGFGQPRPRGEYGVPEYWDLNKDQLLSDNPSRRFTVTISKKANQLDTTTGQSKFKVGDAIQVSSRSDVVAFSTAEVYFERPLTGSNKAVNSEKASLFNPYWNVRLVNNTTADMDNNILGVIK